MPNVILRPYLLTLKNRLTVTTSSEHNLKRDAILTLMALVIVLCIFTVNMLILKTVKSNDLYLAIVPTKLVELTYYLFFITLVFSNTVATIGSIYTARNMDLLLTLPISPLRLYLAKVIEIFFESSSMLLMFAIPTSIAFCWSLDLPYSFFSRVILSSLPLLLIPIGLSITIGTLFVRFASVFWRRGALLFLVLGAASIWVIYSVNSTINQVDAGEGALALIKLVALFDNPSPSWLPSRWTADLISEMLGKPCNNAQQKWLLLIASAAGSLALGYLVFDFSALSTRSAASSASKNSETGASSTIAKRDPVRKILEYFFNFLPISQQNRSVILKDLSSLIRDRAQSLQLLLFVAISAVYVMVFKFMIMSLDMHEVAQQLWRGTLASFNILFTGFILTAVMTRLVYPSVSLEGKSFWILQSSPLDLPELLNSKFYCWFPFAMFISLFLLVSGGLALGMSFTELCFISFTATCLAFGCTGLAIGMGASFSSFEWESPNQLSTGLGTLALFGASLLLVCLVTIPATVVNFLLTVPLIGKNIGLYFSTSLAVICQICIFSFCFYAARTAKRRGAAALKAKTLR